MSETIDEAVAALNEKLGGNGIDGTAKFVIEGEGSIMVDETGARAGDEDAEVTMTATRDTFEGMMTGDVNPTTAFMSGDLSVDGDMAKAMQLGSALS